MTNYQEHLESLDRLCNDLDAAAQAADWAGLQRLDHEARQRIEAAATAARSGQLPVDQVTERLDRLQRVYDAARAAAVRARDDASAELRDSGRTHQAAQAYLKNSR